jgi:hypothetical protein
MQRRAASASRSRRRATMGAAIGGSLPCPRRVPRAPWRGFPARRDCMLCCALNVYAVVNLLTIRFDFGKMKTVQRLGVPVNSARAFDRIRLGKFGANAAFTRHGPISFRHKCIFRRSVARQENDDLKKTKSPGSNSLSCRLIQAPRTVIAPWSTPAMATFSLNRTLLLYLYHYCPEFSERTPRNHLIDNGV